MQGKKKTKLIIGIVAALLVIAVVAGAWIYLQSRNKPAEPQTPATQAGKAFTVVVVHADGSEKTFQYRSQEEYVGTVLLEKGLIEGDQGEFGLYIKIVDGEKAVYEEDNAYWSFYIGEEYATTGVDMTPITDGAVYRLVYTKA